MRDLARKLESPSLLMMKMRELLMLLEVWLRRKRKKKKRRRRKSKWIFKYLSFNKHQVIRYLNMICILSSQG